MGNPWEIQGNLGKSTIATIHGPLSIDFPIDFPHPMLVYQRVTFGSSPRAMQGGGPVYGRY